jgi:hypothetical protein
VRLLDPQSFEAAGRALLPFDFATSTINNASRILSGIQIVGKASFSSFMLPPPSGVSIPYGMDGTECPKRDRRR